MSHYKIHMSYLLSRENFIIKVFFFFNQTKVIQGLTISQLQERKVNEYVIDYMLREGPENKVQFRL